MDENRSEENDLSKEDGQATVEFALLASLVVVSLYGIFQFTDLPGTFYAGLKSFYLDLGSLLSLPFP